MRGEVETPVPYNDAIEHVCFSRDYDSAIPVHFRRAAFLLRQAVLSAKVRCAHVMRHGGRPVGHVRTFMGGPSGTDLDALGGDIEYTIYDASDLNEVFPLGITRKESSSNDFDTNDSQPYSIVQHTRQPPKMWEKVALELGAFLRGGGRPDDANKFVHGVLRKLDWTAERSTVSRHVKDLVEYWKTNCQK